MCTVSLFKAKLVFRKNRFKVLVFVCLYMQCLQTWSFAFHSLDIFCIPAFDGIMIVFSNKNSRMSYITLVRISLDWVVSSVIFISKIISVKVAFLKENGKLLQMELIFLFSIYMGGFRFFIVFETGLWWRVKSCWLPMFDAIFEKYPLKISTSSLSSGTILLFWVNVICSSFDVLTVKHSFTILQDCLFSVTRLKSRLLEKSFLVFRNSLTQIFRGPFYAISDDLVLSCLRLFNNFDLVVIDFFKFLVTNATWLHLTYFYFNGSWLSYMYCTAALNESGCPVWTFLIKISSEDHFTDYRLRATQK